MTTGEVRPARRADLDELSRVIARAFYDDPVERWEMPDDTRRRTRQHHLWTAQVRHHHLGGGGVEVATQDGAIRAVAVWDPPGRWQATRWESMRMVPRLMWAFGGDTSRTDAFMAAIEANHPHEPCWYLAIIASDPAVRGTGLGHALMRSRLDRCDAERMPAYLESTNPDNLPYYQRFGFEVIGDIPLPDGGPTMQRMWREPH